MKSLAIKHKTSLLRRAKTKQGGFSLIELMIVVAILGIIAGFAAPAISGWIADTKTRSVAEALQNGIRLAQTEAVRRGVQVQFVLTNAAPTAKDVTASSTGRNWVIQTMQLADASKTDEFIQGAALGGVSSTSLIKTGEATLTFNSIGRLISPAKKVEYVLENAKGSRHLNVTVSIAGKIRMCDPDKAIAISPDGCK